MTISGEQMLFKKSFLGFKLLGPWKKVIDQYSGWRGMIFLTQVNGAGLFDTNVKLRPIWVHFGL